MPQSCVSRIFDGEKREEATVRDKQLQELCLIKRTIGTDRVSTTLRCLSLDVGKSVVKNFFYIYIYIYVRGPAETIVSK